MISRLARKKTNQQDGQEKKSIIDFRLGLDVRNMGIHSFSIQLRYKALMILRWPPAKSRKEKIPASPYRKKNRQEKKPQPPKMINGPSLTLSESFFGKLFYYSWF